MKSPHFIMRWQKTKCLKTLQKVYMNHTKGFSAIYMIKIVRFNSVVATLKVSIPKQILSDNDLGFAAFIYETDSWGKNEILLFMWYTSNNVTGTGAFTLLLIWRQNFYKTADALMSHRQMLIFNSGSFQMPIPKWIHRTGYLWKNSML